MNGVIRHAADLQGVAIGALRPVVAWDRFDQGSLSQAACAACAVHQQAVLQSRAPRQPQDEGVVHQHAGQHPAQGSLAGFSSDRSGRQHRQLPLRTRQTGEAYRRVGGGIRECLTGGADDLQSAWDIHDSQQIQAGVCPEGGQVGFQAGVFQAEQNAAQGGALGGQRGQVFQTIALGTQRRPR